jgi:hypothetical protein
MSFMLSFFVIKKKSNLQFIKKKIRIELINLDQINQIMC